MAFRADCKVCGKRWSASTRGVDICPRCKAAREKAAREGKEQIMHVCPRCKLSKPESAYWKDSGNKKNGLYHYCIKCALELRDEKEKDLQSKESFAKLLMEMSDEDLRTWCTSQGFTHDEIERLLKERGDWKAVNEVSRSLQELKATLKEHFDEPTDKLCMRCKERRPLAMFERVKYTPDGYSAWCTECSSKAKTMRKKRHIEDNSLEAVEDDDEQTEVATPPVTPVEPKELPDVHSLDEIIAIHDQLSPEDEAKLLDKLAREDQEEIDALSRKRQEEMERQPSLLKQVIVDEKKPEPAPVPEPTKGDDMQKVNDIGHSRHSSPTPDPALKQIQREVQTVEPTPAPVQPPVQLAVRPMTSFSQLMAERKAWADKAEAFLISSGWQYRNGHYEKTVTASNLEQAMEIESIFEEVK